MISTYVTEGRLAVNFPRLMRSVTDSSLILLFLDENQGTILAVGHDEAIHTVGEFCNNWDPEAFEVFDGEVSLCNDQDVAGYCYSDDQDDEDEADEYCGLCHQQGCGEDLSNTDEAEKSGDIFINGKVIESNTALYAELMKTLSVKPTR